MLRLALRSCVALVCILALPVACTGGNAGPTSAPAAPTAVPVTLHYTVTGMHCEGCVDYITSVAKQVDGVIDCTVSLENTEAVIVLRDAEVAPRVEAAITKGGYTLARK
jgi:copper chaperone CopZ